LCDRHLREVTCRRLDINGSLSSLRHGLTYRNLPALAAIPEITEFNIGHNIISRAVFVGLNQAVREMIEAVGHPTV
jgi:pyridoxine 5-phosphate synthase